VEEIARVPVASAAMMIARDFMAHLHVVVSARLRAWLACGTCRDP
jgi:hypothetical protein